MGFDAETIIDVDLLYINPVVLCPCSTKGLSPDPVCDP